MKFTKMHGLGNDFVVVDAINQRIALTPKKIRFMANRHTGIGFDQLLVVEKQAKNMRILNTAFSTRMAQKLDSVATVHGVLHDLCVIKINR